jgi:SH3-like domain-containing protein
MSFRNVLIAITLSMIFAAEALAQDAVPQPDVVNSKYQIEGVINVDSIYVRSGPGEGYYPTQTLSKGANITVVGIKFDWLKILPPEGNFSYVGAVFVDKSADGSTGKINRNDVNIRAGSLVNAMKTTVQTRLSTGDQVQIVGKEDEYLKIKPPAGAYLYVNKEFVTIARPAVAANTASANAPLALPAPTQDSTASANQNPAPAPKAASPSIDASPAIVTRMPTTAPSQAAALPTTNPSALAAAPSTRPAPVAAAPPPPSAEELFAQYEAKFTEISKQPLDSQPIEDLMTKYQSIANGDGLSDELKRVVDIRIATLKARQDNKVKLVEIQRLQKLGQDRQLALQAEQQELAERLKQNQIQVFVAVGTLQPSSLQVGGGTLYRLVDPATGRTEIYVRTSDPKITGLMGQFVGINGQPTEDPQLSLRVIAPTDAQAVDQAKVNSSVMASIIPPSLLARQASAN